MVALLLAALTLLGQWTGLGWSAGVDLPVAEATHTRIKMPFSSNQSWRISQGYNTSPVEGGSHWNCDPVTLKDSPSQTRTCRAAYQYKYSLDLARSDGNTAGEAVLSPVDGTIRWIDEVAGGMSINLGDGYAVAFFHAVLAPGLVEGQPVTQGQVLGTVAPAGVASNGGFPHIHIALWQTTDGGNWSRNAIPFTGTHTLDGFDFPALADTTRNQHRTQTIYSTNSGTPGTVPAAPTLKSPATGTVFPATTTAVTFSFNPVANATEYQVVIDGTTYSPWLTGTSWTSGQLPAGSHRWQVRARNGDVVGPLSSEWVFSIDAGTTTPSTPTLSLSQTQGPAAITVSVGGSGFTAGEQVSVRWDSATATPLATVTANSQGAFSTQVRIPDATRGSHTLYATGATSGARASVVYTLTASLARTPYEGVVGTKVAVTARGFGASEQITVTWRSATGPTLGTAVTNGVGTASLTITIPNTTGGWNDYTAVGTASGIRAWGAIRVLPSVSVSPTSTVVGAQVTISGQGFPAGQSITAAWNKTSTNAGSQLCAGTVSATGTFSCTFTVPATTAGTYPVALTSADGTTQSATVTVTGPPAVTVSPGSGAVGTNITITVGGFNAGETISLNWDGVAWQSATADSAGSATVRATVPQLAAGSHTLQARGGTSGKTASTTFTVSTTATVGTTSMVAPGTYVVTATR
ncbi:MAG: M23 family metallopeptidase, partial [Chloroflexota bacterium]|nr:M23 family metallopeptidase [Chloroflexota bacterium]